MKLLLAEDEIEISNAVKKFLNLSGYEVDTAFNGEDAMDLALDNHYDGIIMDIMMPKINGLEVVQKLRKDGCGTPILMLTALAELDDKVTGLDVGADDYLTKPFATKELLARVKALTRRNGQAIFEYSFGNLKLNANASEMTAQESVSLTNKEFKLMELLVRNQNILLSSDQIMERVWGYESDAEINTVWVFISTLRKKLEQIGADCTIKAVRGVGYKLEMV